MNPVGGARVGCGNLWDDDYVLPDGRTVHGMTATLAVAGTEDRMVVGVGSVADIGGRLWRVVAIDKEQGRRGTVTLRPVEEGVTWDGVDFGPKTDLRQLVHQQLVHWNVGTTRRDDRTEIDWVKRAYDALRTLDTVSANRLARSVAQLFGQVDSGIDALVAKFYEDRPGAPGRGILANWMIGHPEGVSTERNPVPGSAGRTVREAAFGVALWWYHAKDRDPDPALLEQVHREIDAGRADGLIGVLSVVEPTYVDQHFDALLRAHPSAAGSLLAHLLDHGMQGAAAVAKVLPHADAAGRSSMRSNVSLSSRSEDEKRALLALIPEGPPPPSAPPPPPEHPSPPPKVAKGVGAQWSALVQQGADPLDALDRFLPTKTRQEAGELWDAIDREENVDPGDKQPLYDRLMGKR